MGTVFFSALSFSAAVIILHGAMREPDNLFVDDVDVSAAVGNWPTLPMTMLQCTMPDL